VKTPTIEQMTNLITELRAIAPKRPLTYGESLQVARVQAAKLRKWAHVTTPEIRLAWLVRQRTVPVNVVASHKLKEESGLTTNAVNGKLQMFINQNEPPVRQRFSLLHEFKHVLDFDDADTLHDRLGSGDQRRQARQIELICNDFAAHVLMPTAHVKRAWFQLQDVPTLANLFDVSAEAMFTRLDKLSLVGEPKPTRSYFRTLGTNALGAAPCVAA
jgi:predicted transcriptional regulator